MAKTLTLKKSKMAAMAIGVVAPLTNDPILSGRLIRSFRHPELQYLSTGDHFIIGSGIIVLVSYFTTIGVVDHLKMILSYRVGQYC